MSSCVLVQYDVLDKLSEYTQGDEGEGRARLFRDLFQDSKAMAFREGGRQHNDYRHDHTCPRGCEALLTLLSSSPPDACLYGCPTLHSYKVPDQWQGTYSDELVIIGDKKGGGTAATLADDPEKLDRVRDLVQGTLTLHGVGFDRVMVAHGLHCSAHQVDSRHPQSVRCDSNAHEAYRGQHVRLGMVSQVCEEVDSPLSRYRAIEFRTFLPSRFEAQIRAVRAVKERASEYPMFDLRSDEMITDTERTLERLFVFLEVPYTREFISACASIVYKEPHKSRYALERPRPEAVREPLPHRFEFEWRDEDKKQVADLIARTEWFSGYSFDS